MNIILQIGRTYSWTLLTSIIASIKTPWSLFISFPSICRDRFRNTFRCATQHMEVRFNKLVRAFTFFHNYLCRETPSRYLANKFCILVLAVEDVPIVALGYTTNIYFIRLISNYNITQNLLETTSYHNTYSVISTNLHGSLYLQKSVYYFIDSSKFFF